MASETAGFAPNTTTTIKSRTIAGRRRTGNTTRPVRRNSSDQCSGEFSPITAM
jgi:hypothetical protein